MKTPQDKPEVSKNCPLFVPFFLDEPKRIGLRANSEIACPSRVLGPSLFPDDASHRAADLLSGLVVAGKEQANERIDAVSLAKTDGFFGHLTSVDDGLMHKSLGRLAVHIDRFSWARGVPMPNAKGWARVVFSEVRLPGILEANDL